MNLISLATPSSAEEHLDDAGEDDGGDEVVEAVLAHDGGDDQGDRTRGGRDHRRAGRRRGRSMTAIVNDAKRPTGGRRRR